MKDKLARLSELLKKIAAAEDSNFYRDLADALKSAGLPETTEDLARLPILTRERLLSFRLLDRLYFKGDGYVKRVATAGLIKRTLKDLGVEDLGQVDFERPLVIFGDSGETCEKALWVYEKNLIPLVGEANNLPATLKAAGQYQIDCIITESRLLEKLWPLLENSYNTGRIKRIILQDSRYDKENLNLISADVAATRLLSLPETGPFAYACPEAVARGELTFHPDKNSIIEFGKSLLLTKLIYLPTPLIRYETGLAGGEAAKECSCAAETSFIS